MTSATKAALRQRLLAARRAVAPDVHTQEADALVEHLKALTITAGTVCGYVPVGTEPGSIAMLDSLLQRGLRVLLPVVHTSDSGAPMALLWGDYQPGGLVDGRLGLLEPVPPWLPPTALATAGVVIVPALAVDRRGVRLGRGAGYYDRSLPLRDVSAQLVAVVRDTELITELPSEPHDVPMTHVLTPGRGLVTLTGMPGISPPE